MLKVRRSFPFWVSECFASCDPIPHRNHRKFFRCAVGLWSRCYLWSLALSLLHSADKVEEAYAFIAQYVPFNNVPSIFTRSHCSRSPVIITPATRYVSCSRLLEIYIFTYLKIFLFGFSRVSMISRNFLPRSLHLRFNSFFAQGAYTARMVAMFIVRYHYFSILSIGINQGAG